MSHLLLHAHCHKTLKRNPGSVTIKDCSPPYILSSLQKKSMHTDKQIRNLFTTVYLTDKICPLCYFRIDFAMLYRLLLLFHLNVTYISLQFV